MKAWEAMVCSVVVLAVGASAVCAATTERVSVSSAGEQGNDSSSWWGCWVSVSADGRFVSFESGASNLAAADTNGVTDIFVRDRLTGRTELVSVSSSGEPGNGPSQNPYISADGRFVGFRSAASNLVVGDTNGEWDVFVRDRVRGTTERVSVSSTGQEGNGDCFSVALSGDGRFASFSSLSSNLVPDDTNGFWDVFVHDRATGETELVSLSSTGEQGNQSSYGRTVSDDGRFVAFDSIATNLVPGPDENNHGDPLHPGEDVFVRDRLTGTTECVSVNSSGERANNPAWYCFISGSGRYVSFQSNATNLVPGDTNGRWDVFVHDRLTGTTERVSVSTLGTQGNGDSYSGQLRGDLRFIPFFSDASDLVPDDTNSSRDTFVHDRLTRVTERVSVSTAGEEGSADSRYAALSANGRIVAFESDASNLVTGDTNGVTDIFVRDRGNGAAPVGWHATFEEQRSPWTVFAAGPGAADTWRKVVLGDPQAHSGAHVMSAEIADQAITGLRLALPTDPTGPAEAAVEAWVHVARHAGDAACFVGFALGDTYPRADDGWAQMLGYEVLSDTSGVLRLAGDAVPVDVGLPPGEWHLVKVGYRVGSGRVTLSLDGETVCSADATGVAGVPPAYAVLGALGGGPGATAQVFFDDAGLTMSGYFGTPMEAHPYALLTGRERVAGGQSVSYELTYGNGYPMLGLKQVDQTLPETMHIGLSIPDGYSLVSADPAPARLSGGALVWDVDLPVAGECDSVALELQAPLGVMQQTTDRLWAWATTDAGAGSSYPPAPPDWASPPDAVWGAPADVLPQLIDVEPIADVWVHKQGPAVVAGGDAIGYAITVGNCGSADVGQASVHDLMPELLGGEDQVVAALAGLSAGGSWSGLALGVVPPGTPGGTVLLNQAYCTPTDVAEVSLDNNLSEWITTVASSWLLPAPAGRVTAEPSVYPVMLSAQPEGEVDPDELLTYTMECRNTGPSSVGGVYVSLPLDPCLDGSTLVVYGPDSVAYDSVSRNLVWRVGPLGPGEAAATTFEVQVANDAPPGERISSQAVAHFPSSCEDLPSNIVRHRTSGLPLAADFSGAPLQGAASLIVQFSDLSTGNPTRWSWSFGDGASSSSQSPSHTYTSVGTYTVALTVANGGGWDTETREHYIHVTFSDVPADHWAMHQILACVDAGIVGGYPNGTYRPTNPVDRGSMAVYVSRGLAGGDANVPPGPETATFDDVPTDHWAYKYVEYAVDQNVVAGFPNGTYRPALLVDRGQMAVFVARALVVPSGDAGVPDGPPDPTFPDVTSTNDWAWCYKHVEYIAEQGVTQGYPDGKYHPEYICTRDQMAVYVQRAFGLPL